MAVSYRFIHNFEVAIKDKRQSSILGKTFTNNAMGGGISFLSNVKIISMPSRLSEYILEQAA